MLKRQGEEIKFIDMINEMYGNELSTRSSFARPKMCLFKNISRAINMIAYHIKRNEEIAIHMDVDFDGVASGFVCCRAIECLGGKVGIKLINKDKIHGITKRHLELFNKEDSKTKLLVIVDSSSGEETIEVIKKFKCDVLVIDHHNIKGEGYGVCEDGVHRYVIVNCNLENDEFEEDKKWLSQFTEEVKGCDKYIATDKMSGCEVVYELMRVMYCAVGKGMSLENQLLHQWVAVTIFTDSIDTLSERNLWYLNSTVTSKILEPTLCKMRDSINKYNCNVSKSFINYKIAPLINKSIRAGHSGEAMTKVFKVPSTLYELNKYDKPQKEAIEKVVKEGEILEGSYVMKNVTEYNVHKNYNGVIASKYSGRGFNCVVFSEIDGEYVGSFRGRESEFNYLGFFNDNGIHAEGHQPAFGFRTKDLDKLREVMESIPKYEKGAEKNEVSVGNVPDGFKCKFHIDNMKEFKALGYYMLVAVSNSNVQSGKEIGFIVPTEDVTVVERNQKYFNFEYDGIRCIGFEELQGRVVKIELDFDDGVKAYVRNVDV